MPLLNYKDQKDYMYKNMNNIMSIRMGNTCIPVVDSC